MSSSVHTNKFYGRFFAWLLAAVMILGSIPVSVVSAKENTQSVETDNSTGTSGESADDETQDGEAQEVEIQVIEIHNAQELQELAANCKLDAWSANVRVELCDDISLSGSEFEPIQIFSGVFDGKGHTISGIYLNGDGYADGFFRYVAETAVIQNLTVSGIVESDNEKECVGGIAGINQGTIMNCTFIGVVKGQNAVGGISGENESTGIISNCKSYGSISGYDSVGGITGKNHGSVMTCENDAGINNDIAGVEERDSEGLDWILDAVQTDDVRLRSNIDVGGIAGYSDGIITYCINSGVVGYEHVGYNVGGIVGRQSGLLTYCNNNGEVYGRKDVGGIVGQMEPFISVDEAQSISNAVQELHDRIEKLLDDLDTTQNVLSNDFDELSGYSDSALDHGEAISDQLIDFTDANIDSVNDLSANMDYVMDRLPGILTNTRNAMDYMTTVSEDLKRVNDDLDVIDKLQDSQYDETQYRRLSIVNGVGGTVSADNINPDDGATVTLTANPENGYKVKNITVTDASGKAVTCTQTAGNQNEYKFVMPQGNVVVRVEYDYTGAYIPASNAGGNVYVSINNNAGTVKISVLPDGGYHFDGVYVGSAYYDRSRFTLDNSTYTLEIAKQEYGTPVLVSTTFTKDSNSHKVTQASSAGGYLTLDKQNAAAGETVTVTVHEESNYKLTSITVNGAALTASATANEYTFTMPSADADVQAVFAYQTSSDTEVYTESDIGGSVVAVRNVGSNNYSVAMTPASGYQVSDRALIITGNGQSAVNVNKTDMTESGSSYTYTINKNNYNQPIRVYGCFEKISGANSVNVTDGTGGLVTVDQTSASAGDKVIITVAPLSGYRMTSLSVRSGGNDVTYTARSTEHTYEFTMPDADVDVLAEFEPVKLMIVSNAGGSATTSVDGNTVTLTVSPNTGYTLTAHPTVTDQNGNAIQISKKNAGSYTYTMQVDKTMEPVKIVISFALSSDYQTVQDAKDRINANSDILQNSMDAASDTVSAIEKLTQDDYGNQIPIDDLLNDSEKMDELGSLLIDLAKEMTDAGNAASAIVSDLNTIANVLSPYVEDASKQANKDIEAALDHVEKVLNELKSASDGLKGIVDYLNAQADIRMTGLGGDFSTEVDGLFDDLDRISGCMSRIGDHIDSYSDLINEDLRAVNDQMNTVFQLFIDKMDDAENLYMEDNNYEDSSYNDVSTDTIVTEDISDEELTEEELEEQKNGRVEKCTNRGKVEGDLNIGGIAGSMAIDEEDPEDNAAGKVDRSLGNKYLTRCVMIGCINQGNILAKKDGVGCIAGYMNLGVIMECEAYGTAESTEGEYIGGICGQSLGLIRDSYALCYLTGSRYVGGIAGYGDRIQNCYSMALVDSEAERTGAIAGWIDMTDEDERTINPEEVYGNCFVSSRLNGIDDISYVGVAEPVTYGELLETEGLPYSYRHLTVSFVVDGDVIQQTEASYGDSLEDIEFPKIPERENYYGIWNMPSYDTVEGNITIEAEYMENITTLTSKEGVTSSDDIDTGDGANGTNHKPYALADGVFDDNARLSAVISDVEVPEKITGNGAYVAYDITLEGLGALAQEQETRVRLYHAFEGDAKVYQYIDGEWEEMPSKSYGSYEQIVMKGTQGTFCVVTDESGKIWIAVVAGAVVLLVIVVVIIKTIQKRKLRKDQKRQVSEGKE